MPAQTVSEATRLAVLFAAQVVDNLATVYAVEALVDDGNGARRKAMEDAAALAAASALDLRRRVE